MTSDVIFFNQHKSPTRERRKAPRRSFFAMVTIAQENGQKRYDGKALNFSRAGMRLSTDAPLNILAKVNIKVEQATELPRNQQFTGKVIWCETMNDLDLGLYCYGIKLE